MPHGDRSVDVFVRKLRSKLQRLSAGWRYIHTHFGIGYRLQPEPLIPEPGPEPKAADSPAAEKEDGEERLKTARS
jgi:DNA-binding winged helix-turn-helix (wHTH) protein